jgi:DNA-binding GntR family transcriptional regulator
MEVILTNQTEIRRLSVADQVYVALRKGILSGTHEAGQRVVEAQIAKTLSVSRAPVREAVNRLVKEGLLEVRPNHYGPFVVQLTAQAMRDLYEVRTAIECLAIRKLAGHCGEQAIGPLNTSIEAMEKAAAEGSLENVVEAEMAFHRCLRELSGNSFVVRVGDLLDGIVQAALIADNKAYLSLHDVADEHRPVVEAIRKGDPDEAVLVMAQHISASLGKLRAE